LSWEDACRISLNNVNNLLPRFFDPLENLTAQEYFELARSLLELYRCYLLLRLEDRKLERIDDTLMLLKELIELSAKVVIEKYRSHEYREKLRESLKTLGESEVKMLNEYLKLGLQLIGYNLPSLVPFLLDKLFIQYLGTVLKISAAIAVGVKKYWAKRTIRKFSVNLERLARQLAERVADKLEDKQRQGKKPEIDDGEVVNNIIGSATSQNGLTKLTEELYSEQVYANTPEVTIFTGELQKLRAELLGITCNKT